MTATLRQRQVSADIALDPVVRRVGAVQLRETTNANCSSVFKPQVLTTNVPGDDCRSCYSSTSDRKMGFPPRSSPRSTNQLFAIDEA